MLSVLEGVKIQNAEQDGDQKINGKKVALMTERN